MSHSPTEISQNTFYAAYDRSGQGTILKPKHCRQFYRDFVQISAFVNSMSVLELGCGNGLFLQYLQSLGVSDFTGVDSDPRVVAEMPANLAAHVQISDFRDFFETIQGRVFDRVVLFDVLEHFSPEDAVTLLRQIATVLAEDGRVVLRVPNMSSPLGMNVQFNDVTHKTCFTPGSLRQVAKAADFSVLDFRPQAYSSWIREMRERALTSLLSWFLSAPPAIWSPNFIGVLAK